MGRVKAEVIVTGHSYWALFDGGARNTYVVEEIASFLPSFELERPETVALGGEMHNVTRVCLLNCLVEGLPVRALARVLKEIGKDEEGKRVEILIGALTMEEWGIMPVPAEKRLDMSSYPKEFVEY